MEDNLTQIKIDIEHIRMLVDQNTVDLSEHIEGVVQNRGRIEIIEKCLAEIQGIGKFIRFSAMLASLLFGSVYFILKIYPIIIK